MRAEGEKFEVIAAQLKTPKATLETWMCPGWGSLTEELAEYKAYLSDIKVQSTEDFQKEIAKDAKVLWERLKSLALSDDDEVPRAVRLGALDSALDRIGVARVSKTEGKVGISISDEDRRRRFEELKAIQADVLPEQVLRLAGKVNS